VPRAVEANLTREMFTTLKQPTSKTDESRTEKEVIDHHSCPCGERKGRQQVNH